MNPAAVVPAGMLSNAQNRAEKLAFQRGFALGSLRQVRQMIEAGASREHISEYIRASLIAVEAL